MKIVKLIKLAIQVTIFCALANTAMAVTCIYKDNILPPKGTMPLQVSALTVGRDVPVGQVIFRQSFSITQAANVTVTCSFVPYTYLVDNDIITALPLAYDYTGPYSGSVYRTNISGLGVAYLNSEGKPYPVSGNLTNTGNNCTIAGRACDHAYGAVTRFELLLIKIGDVSPGILQGSQLPVVELNAYFAGNKMNGFSMGTTGSIQIVASTCNTSNVSVPMGTYKTSEFGAIDSGTTWKNFAIELNNCPAFNGAFTTNGPGWVSQGGNNSAGTPTAGTLNKNTVQFRIDPSQPALSANRGILSLDPASSTSAVAASGVGVQIATANGVELPLATVRDSGLNLLAAQGSYSIPLRARYIKTSANVTPGPANASATFTIIYQ